MATQSSILAWKIPWTEQPGRLQSMGLQRVTQDWGAKTFLQGSLKLFCCSVIHWCAFLPSFPLILFLIPSFFFFLIWPWHRACGILVPQPEPMPSAVGVYSLSHLSTRKVFLSSIWILSKSMSLLFILKKNYTLSESKERGHCFLPSGN